MIAKSGWKRGSLLVAAIVSLVVMPQAWAGGPRGSHPRGVARRPHGMATPQRMNRALMPRAPQMSRANNSGNRANNLAQPRKNNNLNNANNNRSLAANPTPTATSTSGFNTTGLSPNTYRYGSGNHASNYKPYGYGRGYNNQSNTGSHGFNSSQNINRSAVTRLRSVHKSLARLDHDYKGHRVQAMHHVNKAIRQLSHRSTNSGNNVMATNTNRRTGTAGANGNGNGNGNGANGRRTTTTPHLSQAQSDSRMSQALRTTQGIAMQMSNHSSSNQGTRSSGHSQAYGYLQRAMGEMHTALTVR